MIDNLELFYKDLYNINQDDYETFVEYYLNPSFDRDFNILYISLLNSNMIHNANL